MNDSSRRMQRIYAAIMGLSGTVFGIWWIIEPMRDPKVYWDWQMMGLAILFLGGGQLLILAAISPDLKNLKVFWVELAMVLILIPVLGFWGRVGIRIERAAASICNGEILSNASAYSMDKGVRPIMIIYEADRRSIKSKSYPPDWLPKNVRELQLVACIKEDWQTVEDCYYEGDSRAERMQHYMEITVLEAQSGQVVDNLQLHGDLPRECGAAEIFNEGIRYKLIKGDSISTQQLTDHLRDFVSR